MSDLLIQLIVTVYARGVERLIVHADVWLRLRLTGTHEVVNRADVDAAVRETAPLKPPVDWREIVEDADCPATNETVFGLAVIEKSGVAGVVTVTEIEVVWTQDALGSVAVTVYDPGVELASVHVDV